ncbi:hypothetical protein [Maledivibacter halophilus]|uniref:Uncharacterized protein n=1 Tax=Maledivibacter halophilus TaxID=36842 RepID=A0A1T5IC81_9FIRM|nr:hypothetical protein [Maledivibacter halophilus]SKC36794.1 hypothetical protein SAMN02194393_00200 [Maledivibacter halophilus]
MKKIFSLLLILILVLSIVGCSKETISQKTEEELRAEIKAEMEAEEKLKEELKAEMKAEMEAEKKDEASKYNEELRFLKGKLLGYGLYGGEDGGTGIILDNPIIVDNRRVKEIFFEDESILNFVPRKYFTYCYEGGTTFTNDGKIPIEIETDPKGYKYNEEYDRISGTMVKVISVDGEKNLVDKTENEYPLEYYKTLVLTRVYDGVEVLPKNIKEHYFYKNTDTPLVGDEFKKAVDKILEAGYSIRQIEGEFSIVDLSEETPTEVDITLSAKEFLEKYPTDYVATEEDAGYHGYNTTYEYPYTGMTVRYYHGKENNLENAELGSIDITEHLNKIKDLDITIGMSLAEAYEYCDTNLEKHYDRHSDTYVDEVYEYNGLVLALNDRGFGEHDEVSSDDQVTKISLWLLED